MLTRRSARSPRSLDRDASMPLYLQLAGCSRGRIKRGEWRAGQKIPSENELNRLYGVSRMTARQVLAQLVSERSALPRAGQGHIRRPARRSPPARRRTRGSASSSGHGVRRRHQGVLHRTRSCPAETRGQGPADHGGEPVHEIRRVRLLADDEPISLHTSYVPERLATSSTLDDLVNRQLCVILERRLRPADEQGHREPESTLPNAQEAKDPPDPPQHSPAAAHARDLRPGGAGSSSSPASCSAGDKLRLQFHYDLWGAAAGTRGGPQPLHVIWVPAPRPASVRARRRRRRRRWRTSRPARSSRAHPAHRGRSPRGWPRGTGRPPVNELTVTTWRRPGVRRRLRPRLRVLDDHGRRPDRLPSSLRVSR